MITATFKTVLQNSMKIVSEQIDSTNPRSIFFPRSYFKAQFKDILKPALWLTKVPFYLKDTKVSPSQQTEEAGV